MNPGGFIVFFWHIMVEKGGQEWEKTPKNKNRGNKLYMHVKKEPRIAFQSDLTVRIRETEECEGTKCLVAI